MSQYNDLGTWIGACQCGKPLLSKSAGGVKCSDPECPVEKSLQREADDALERGREAVRRAALAPKRRTVTDCPDGKDTCRRGCNDVCRRMWDERPGTSIDKAPQ